MRNERSYTSTECLVTLAAGQASGVGLGLYFADKFTGGEWLLPGVIVGMTLGFCSTFFLLPAFTVRAFERRQAKQHEDYDNPTGT